MMKPIIISTLLLGLTACSTFEMVIKEAKHRPTISKTYNQPTDSKGRILCPKIRFPELPPAPVFPKREIANLNPKDFSAMDSLVIAYTRNTQRYSDEVIAIYKDLRMRHECECLEFRKELNQKLVQ